MPKPKKKVHLIRHGSTVCSAERDPNKRHNMITTTVKEETTCGICLVKLEAPRPTGFRGAGAFRWSRVNNLS